MRAEGGEFACEAVDDCFLFFFEFEVQFGGCHGAWVAHGDARGVVDGSGI